MNRELFKYSFQLGDSPNWICPTCSKGNLKIKKDSFIQEESAYSRKNADHPDYGFIFFEAGYVYTCVLVCSNEVCSEVVISTGTVYINSEVVGVDEDGEIEEDVEYYCPKYFQPSLKIIQVPQKCSSTLTAALDESFKLFFSSPSSAANNVRIALEELLTALNVKRFTISRGKRKPITLHHRIENLPPKYSHFKEMMLAIKWLGNAGSHSHDEITRDDILDAYELLEHVLNEIYQPTTKRLTAIAKKVNKKKGPA
jgi:hypothetical protein